MVYETAKALQCNLRSACCFDVAIGLPGDVSNYNEDKRWAVAARMQNKAVVETTVKARSEILAICATLKQMSENKYDAMSVVLLLLIKTKIST